VEEHCDSPSSRFLFIDSTRMSQRRFISLIANCWILSQLRLRSKRSRRSSSSSFTVHYNSLFYSKSFLANSENYASVCECYIRLMGLRKCTAFFKQSSRPRLKVYGRLCFLNGEAMTKHSLVPSPHILLPNSLAHYTSLFFRPEVCSTFCLPSHTSFAVLLSRLADH